MSSQYAPGRIYRGCAPWEPTRLSITTIQTPFCYQCFTPPQNEDSHQGEYIYAPLMPILDPPAKSKSLPSSIVILSRWKFAYTCFGRCFTTLVDNTLSMGRGSRPFMVTFYRRIEKLLSKGKIAVTHYQVRGGGLQKVLDRVSLLRAGEVRGYKLVYPI